MEKYPVKKKRWQSFWALFWLALTGVLFSPLQASGWRENLYDNYNATLNGFMEARQGWRTDDDPYEKSESISEARLQLGSTVDLESAIITLKGDLLHDRVEETTQGELREANMAFSPSDTVDLKIGRQTLTWGTGDLLFINDLFPKDWKSFFSGRDDAYLKSPSDALKAGFYFDWFNLDVVYMPRFNPSVFIDGERLSYWNPALERLAGRDAVLKTDERNRFFRDDEWSLRISKNLSGTELAFYGYDGYWSTPEGMDLQRGLLIYPRLQSAGTSVRGELLGGIGHLEGGYYYSADDKNGRDPFIRNSEFRVVAGFEREIGPELTAGIQYYAEIMGHYDHYKAMAPPATRRDQVRQVATLRLTKQLLRQTMTLSFFAYYSPTDEDAYLRPNISYKLSDNWLLESGVNLFAGQETHTFFGQFEKNTNAYAAVRYSF